GTASRPGPRLFRQDGTSPSHPPKTPFGGSVCRSPSHEYVPSTRKRLRRMIPTPPRHLPGAAGSGRSSYWSHRIGKRMSSSSIGLFRVLAIRLSTESIASLPERPPYEPSFTSRYSQYSP